MRGGLAVGLLLASGCSPLGTAELLVPADADGPLGAAVVPLAAAARVTEVVPVDVVFPTAAQNFDEAPVPAVVDAPVVVMIHGGLVPAERYWWLGEHFARQGYVTLFPRAEPQLAISQPGNGAVALEALRREAARDGWLAGIVADDGPVAVAGHSLGGVMAARQWVRDDDVDLLVMMASFPANGDDVEGEAGRPVLAISGTTDGSLPVDEFVERSARYAPPADVWLAAGLNHYGWTDDATEGELRGDGPLEGDLDALRARVLALIDAHLAVALTGAEASRLEGPFEGLEEVE